MAKKTLATSVPEELYVRVKAKAESEGISVMKWMENAAISALNPSETPMDAPVREAVNEFLGKGMEYGNPCWKTGAFAEA